MQAVYVIVACIVCRRVEHCRRSAIADVNASMPAVGYVQLFGEKPRQSYSSPLDKGDHPELDDSEFLPAEEIRIYQSLIGALQWAVSLGRIDITTAVMTMAGFRVEPRRGQLLRLMRM